MDNMNDFNNTNNNIVDNKKNNKVHNVLGASILAVLFTAVACVAFYFMTSDKNNLDSLIPIGTEKYNFENTTVTSGDIKKVSDVSKIVDEVMPSVVAITETTIVDSYQNFFGFYQDSQESVGSGSGIIVGQDDDNYYIVTNNHVVDGADKIEITFVDEKVVQAKVKGTDASNDLAIVSVAKKDMKESTLKTIKVAQMGDSDDLRVGETAIAIGNSLGYGQSVTLGYIGALNREVQLENGTMEAIQTDAAINPGNSGGALLNTDGEVIGINSAKLASEEVEGMGYAIPISKAKPILDKLITKEVVDEDEKGYIGITGRTVTDDEIEVLSYKKGVFVVSVSDNGGAKAAGMKQGDIITKVNDEKVTTIEGLISTLESYKKGEKVDVTIYRNNNGKLKKQTLQVTLGDAKSVSDDSDSADTEQFD